MNFRKFFAAAVLTLLSTLPLSAQAAQQSVDIDGSAFQWCSHENPCENVQQYACMQAKNDARARYPGCSNYQLDCDCGANGSYSEGTASMNCDARGTALCGQPDPQPMPQPVPQPQPGPGPGPQPGNSVACGGALDSWANRVTYSSSHDPEYHGITSWVTFKNHIITMHFTRPDQGHLVGHTYAFDPSDLDPNSGTVHPGTNGGEEFDYIGFNAKGGQSKIEYGESGGHKEMKSDMEWEFQTLEDARGARDQIAALARACGGGYSLNDVLKPQRSSIEPDRLAIEDGESVTKADSLDGQLRLSISRETAAPRRAD